MWPQSSFSTIDADLLLVYSASSVRSSHQLSVVSHVAHSQSCLIVLLLLNIIGPVRLSGRFPVLFSAHLAH